MIEAMKFETLVEKTSAKTYPTLFPYSDKVIRLNSAIVSISTKVYEKMSNSVEENTIIHEDSLPGFSKMEDR